MERFYQAAAGILVAVILILTLRKQGNEIGLLLSVLVCCMLGFMAAGFLEPVVTFLRRLQKIGSLNVEFLGTLLKIVGICFTSEIAGLICEDAGNAALGKALQFLAGAVILYLSLPLLTKLLDLVEGILENV
jgi:stage III sporulation protein AD